MAYNEAKQHLSCRDLVTELDSVVLLFGRKQSYCQVGKISNK